MGSAIETGDWIPSVGLTEVVKPSTSRKTVWRAAVSLEFDLQPVLTWRGDVIASSANGAANRAVKAARKEFAGKKPRSWALVLEKQ
jgi:hypothetical protein